jgi:hypothetical protein
VTQSLPDRARTLWAEFERLQDQPLVPERPAELQAWTLAGLVPHLLDEISGRDVLLTAVRRLTASPDGLYDLPDDVLVPVGRIREALHAGLHTQLRTEKEHDCG